MALRRLIALAAAVALVAGALAVRGQMEGREVAGEDPPGGERTETTPKQPSTTGSGDLVLTCLTELASVCEELAASIDVAVEVRSAGALLDGATDPSALAPGALLAVDPLPAMVADRGGAGGAGEAGQGRVLARSPLVAAVWDERAQVLTDHCGSLSWRCVGDAAATPGTWAAVGGPEGWGPVKPGHAGASSASGLLTLGQLAHAWFDRPDVTARDLDDVGFFTWFAELEQAVPTFTPSSGSPLLAMLQIGPSSFDVVSVIEADAVGLLARAADRAGTLRLRALEPVVTADVVVTPVGEDDGVEELVDAVAQQAPELLAVAGWRVDDGFLRGELAAVASDVTALPPGNGLPAGGTLEALRRTWSEVTR